MNTVDQDILKEAIELRHKLHANPDLSMKEVWTKKTLMEYLKDKTDLLVTDCGKWFYAAYRKDPNAKNIAFRADFDAVPVNEAPDFVSYASRNPGVAHKCGHDGHSAALVAFARMLDRYGAKCNVYVLFQHAEETGQGAEECLPFLEENHIDEIYAVHNMPGLQLGAVAVSEGVVQYASTGMILKFVGQRSHACYPEDGINPAYAISEIVLQLDKLRTSQAYTGLTLITVIGMNVGEHAFGTSAGEGELLLKVRGEYDHELQYLLKKIEVLADHTAVRYGLQWSVEYEDAFVDCYNHAESVQKVKNVALKAGISLQKLAEPFRASEDFGRFTKKVPGAMFYVGDGEKHPALHTSGFDFPDEIIEIIVRMYAGLAEI